MCLFKTFSALEQSEKTRFIRSFFYPFLFLVLIWLIRGADAIFDLSLNEFGLYPLQAKGLIGIITSPLLHADFSHLFANSIPIFILGGLLFYFYKDIAWLIFFLVYIITGLWVWTFARGGAAHIGASGIIYGLASFLFFSGIIRRETSLMVITLLVTFVYGGLIWGVFPHFFPKRNISWESHLMGMLSGLVLAIYYRNQGPQRKSYDWENEEEDDVPDDPDQKPEENKSEIIYHYRNEQEPQ